MAITPRSFRLNPILLFVAIVAAFGFWTVATCPIGDSDKLSFGACEASSESLATWTPGDWNHTIHCLMDRGEGHAAYRAASVSVLFHPQNSMLLNLKGYVAARNGDHATAIYDFRTGERVTGSPDGVFENNIAWATLFRTEGLRFQRQERVLLQTRELYERSLEKGRSCERVHTALFVEYKYADLIARNAGADDHRVADAVGRYLTHYEGYTPCLARLATGDELVVEEILSFAAMDAEMGKLAGITQPTRHLPWVRQAQSRADALDLEIDAAWCRSATPVENAAVTCANF